MIGLKYGTERKRDIPLVAGIGLSLGLTIQGFGRGGQGLGRGIHDLVFRA